MGHSTATHGAPRLAVLEGERCGESETDHRVSDLAHGELAWGEPGEGRGRQENAHVRYEMDEEEWQ
eukprot:4515926-Amphidinium_carterae.1